MRRTPSAPAGRITINPIAMPRGRLRKPRARRQTSIPKAIYQELGGYVLSCIVLVAGMSGLLIITARRLGF